jgi:hypothetical protein
MSIKGHFQTERSEHQRDTDGIVEAEKGNAQARLAWGLSTDAVGGWPNSESDLHLPDGADTIDTTPFWSHLTAARLWVELEVQTLSLLPYEYAPANIRDKLSAADCFDWSGKPGLALGMCKVQMGDSSHVTENFKSAGEPLIFLDHRYHHQSRYSLAEALRLTAILRKQQTAQDFKENGAERLRQIERQLAGAKP